jgi:curved DNA-binding protein CbpA
MAPSEQRNLYRILHVQPEAPPEVIKAAWRALMSTLRTHPDLGGGHDEAARINAAYAVLADPRQRAAYDRSLGRRALGARTGGHPRPAGAPAQVQPGAPAGPRTGSRTDPQTGPITGAGGSSSAPAMKVSDPQFWHLERCCPLCSTPFVSNGGPDPRCRACDSPLTPAPAASAAASELLGRRQGERYANAHEAQVQPAAGAEPIPVRLKDLSLTGLSLHSRAPLPPGSAFRVSGPGFDAVAAVVSQRPVGGAFTVHARLLTLQVLRSNAGTFVSTKV